MAFVRHRWDAFVRAAVVAAAALVVVASSAVEASFAVPVVVVAVAAAQGVVLVLCTSLSLRGLMRTRMAAARTSLGRHLARGQGQGRSLGQSLGLRTGEARRRRKKTGTTARARGTLMRNASEPTPQGAPPLGSPCRRAARAAVVAAGWVVLVLEPVAVQGQAVGLCPL